MNFLSSKNFQRLLFLLFFIAIILIKTNILLIYEIVFFASYEYLNGNKKYLQLQLYSYYNWFFLFLLGFIILVRADLFNFSDAVDYHLNSVEHLFFSFIVCLLLSVYMTLLNVFAKYKALKLVFIFVAFNFIGLLNEYFQNYFQHSDVLLLKENDSKDMMINLLGSILFVIFSYILRIKKVV
jgi:hypothetical protein